MNNFELLEKEIMDMCRDNGIEFKWTIYDYIDAYKFEFAKLNKGRNVIITRRDMCIKKFNTIKTELMNAIFTLIKETK